MYNIVRSEILSEINSINMDIYEMSYAKIGTDWHSRNVCSDFTRIYMIIDGGGKLTYGNREIIMRRGNIYIIPSGSEFSYSCDDFLEKIYFHVSLSSIGGYDMLREMNSIVVLEDKGEIISRLGELIFDRKISSVIEVKSTLYNILSESVISSNKLTEPSLKYSSVVKKALRYIENNLCAKISIPDIADKLYVSVSKLQKQFKAEVGVSIGKYIDDKLIFKGEMELRKGKKSIKEISEMLGWCDQFYFSRKFSQKYGVSPKKYKSNLDI